MNQDRPSIDMGTLVFAGVMAVGVALAVLYFATRAMEAEQENAKLREQQAAAASKPPEPEPIKPEPIKLPPAPEPEPIKQPDVPLQTYVDLPPESQALIWGGWVDRVMPDAAGSPQHRKAFMGVCLSKASAFVDLMPSSEIKHMTFSDLETVVDKAVPKEIARVMFADPPKVPGEIRVFDRVAQYAELSPVDRAIIVERWFKQEHPNMDDDTHRVRLAMCVAVSAFTIEEMSARDKQDALLIRFFQEMDKKALDLLESRKENPLVIEPSDAI